MRKLQTADGRKTLTVRRKPYFVAIERGVALGFRANLGPGSWSVKIADGKGGHTIRKIADADDVEPSNGSTILSYHEAITAARRMAKGGAAAGKVLTVAEAIDVYERDLVARGGLVANAGRIRHSLKDHPGIAAKSLSALTAKDLAVWRDGLVAKVAPGTVNRTISAFAAALQLAARHDPRIELRAWSAALRKLPNAERSRNVVLSDAEIRSVVDAAYGIEPALGLLIEVLATTGTRPSQAKALRVADLQDDRAGPRLMIPVSRKGGGKKQRSHAPVPIPAGLARKLRGGYRVRAPP